MSPTPPTHWHGWAVPAAISLLVNGLLLGVILRLVAIPPLQAETTIAVELEGVQVRQANRITRQVKRETARPVLSHLPALLREAVRAIPVPVKPTLVPETPKTAPEPAPAPEPVRITPPAFVPPAAEEPFRTAPRAPDEFRPALPPNMPVVSTPDEIPAGGSSTPDHAAGPSMVDIAKPGPAGDNRPGGGAAGAGHGGGTAPGGPAGNAGDGGHGGGDGNAAGNHGGGTPGHGPGVAVGAGAPGSDGNGAGNGSGPGSGTGSGATPGPTGQGGAKDAGAGDGHGPEAGAGSGAGPRGESRGARVRKQSRPPYPSSARSDGVEGTVVLQVSLDANGKVTAVTVATGSGDARLDKAAERAVKSWAFDPKLEDGAPVASTLRVRVQFRLED